MQHLLIFLKIHSFADPYAGDSWADSVENTVHLEGDKIKHIRIEVRVDASTSSETSRVVQWFEDELGEEEDSGKMRSELSGIANVYVTGDLVALQNVLDGLNSSQLSSTAISFIVSFVVLLLLTRRPVPAIVVLTPVVLATLWVVGSMVVLSLKWNVLTVMVTALSLGIGIDYVIHMWRRFESEREKARRCLGSLGRDNFYNRSSTRSFGRNYWSRIPCSVVLTNASCSTIWACHSLTVTYSLILSILVLPVLLLMSENNSPEENESIIEFISRFCSRLIKHNANHIVQYLRALTFLSALRVISSESIPDCLEINLTLDASAF